MPHTIVPAGMSDAADIAALHAESWRSAYVNLVPDAFLAGPVLEERLRFWKLRMEVDDEGPRQVLKALRESEMVGFVCVLRDADPAWGPLLDNLHVRPAFKGIGIGHDLFVAAREWAAEVAPGRPMHLWVIEGNANARRFYDRMGGEVVERRILGFTAGITTPALRYLWDPLR